MSASSSEGSPAPQDLAAKYQKITSEYAKIRAQNGVLKKAVFDEQAHAAELKESLRLKDVCVRKAEQEIDSLNFRNQQLTKRVAMLLNELETAQKTGKKDKNQGSSNDVPNVVYAEELAKKIAENVNLSCMLEDQAEKFEAEKFKLIQSKEKFEHDMKEYMKRLEIIEKTRLSALELENKDLRLKLNAKEEAVKRVNNEIKVLRSQAYNRSSGARKDHWREKLVKFFQYVGVEDLLRHFIDLFEYLENGYLRSVDPDAGEKYRQCIEANVRSIETLITAYGSYCVSVLNGGDVSVGFNIVRPSIKKCVTLLDDLDHRIVYCKDEEVNRLVKDLMLKLRSHWAQFLSAIELQVTYNRIQSNREEIASAFADIFRSLRATCDFFSSALTDAGAVVKDIANKDLILILAKIGTQSTSIYRKISENKITIINLICSNATAQAHRIPLPESECCRNLKQKLEKLSGTYSKKVKDLEEQIACLIGESNRGSDDDNVCGPSGTRGVGQREIDGGNKSPTDQKPRGASDGTGKRRSTHVRWENQEAELTKYFNIRANNLVSDRQFAESKVTALKSECDALHKRLEYSRRCRALLEDAVKRSQDTIARLQEELTTTTSNYEVQLSSLSEHMANMNDKLAAQQEEIDVLNYQLSEKETKTDMGETSSPKTGQMIDYEANHVEL